MLIPNYIVENIFNYLGYTCVVVLQAKGHRCGYVGISDSNYLYGHDYGEYYQIKVNLKNEELISEEYTGEILEYLGDEFDVHGGITYSNGGKNSNYPINSDLWWFGFDCAHYNDKPDYEAAAEAFKNNPVIIRMLESAKYEDSMNPRLREIRTQEFVINECKKLAEQLKEYEKENERYNK